MKGTRHYVNDANGATADTEVKVRIVNVDPTGTVISYVYEESIEASSEGVTGHGRGHATLTLTGDGFVLETMTHAILDLPWAPTRPGPTRPKGGLVLSPPFVVPSPS